jgi:peptide/nickel transport system substrate-binding protein
MNIAKGAPRVFSTAFLATALMMSSSLAQSYSQAPTLEDAVTSGDLPPVEERVSDNPLVLEPVESVGTYGGVIRDITKANLDWQKIILQVEPFARWERDLNGVRPNVAESWEWNADFTELTLNFRKGIKWSDGVPMTADDFMFFWNDVVLDDSVPVSFPAGTVVNDTPMIVEKLDEDSVKFTFGGPNPLFMELSTRGYYNSSQWLIPAHYMREYLPQFNDQVTDTNEFMARYSVDSRITYTDMPTLAAWVPNSYTPGQHLTAERNPYYWKVDTEGQQLPYIDGFQTTVASDDSVSQAVLLNSIAGNLDFQSREFNLADVSLLLENQEGGNYTVKLWDRGDFAWPWIMIMYDYEDPALVELLYEPNFRRAMSVAMDRNKYNDVVAFGLATPRQFALSPLSEELQTPEGRTFYEEWVNSYIDYAPEQAKAWLDELGVVDQDGDGWRDKPDGSRLQLIVDMQTGDQQTADVMDLIKEDWDAIGLETILNQGDWSTLSARQSSGQTMLRAWGSAAGWGLLSAPTVWAPVEDAEWTMGGMSIALNYQTGGREGTPAPEGSMLEKLQHAYSKAVAALSPEDRNAALLEAYQIHLDEGPITIGTIGEHPTPVVVSNRLRNVPEVGLVGSWDMGFPATADPEQFYFAD